MTMDNNDRSVLSHEEADQALRDLVRKALGAAKRISAMGRTLWWKDLTRRIDDLIVSLDGKTKT